MAIGMVVLGMEVESPALDATTICDLQLVGAESTGLYSDIAVGVGWTDAICADMAVNSGPVLTLSPAILTIPINH